MILESKVYTTLDNIGELVEQGQSLEHLPLQPVYMALKNLPIEQVGNYLVHLTAEQRKLFLDLDLWKKDELDTSEFEFWLAAYAQSDDLEIRDEFAQSEEFALYLKGRFNIWTFDVEDPQYPDHDNYFLTDDSLLLFEFDGDYPFINEVKNIIRNLYSSLGVEHAYAHLFKYVSEGFLTLMEDEYRFKKGRLVDAGFVDYYDALEMTSVFAKRELLDHFIANRNKVTGQVDSFSKKQLLDKRSLVVFENKSDRIDEELSKLGDPAREEYLRFNFIRLVNGTLTLENALKEGSVVCNRVGQYVWDCLILALNYLNDQNKKGVFENFDFTDLYRIGHSLFTLQKRRVFKAMGQNNIGLNDGFTGQFIDRLLTGIDADRPYIEIEDRKTTMDDEQFMDILDDWTDFLVEVTPFMGKLKNSIKQLNESGQLQDDFYLNYNVDQLDFESLMLSSFAKKMIDIPSEQLKLGLTLDEYKDFIQNVIGDDHLLNKTTKVEFKLEEFLKSYGLEDVTMISEYMFCILRMSLEGVDYSSLSDGDYEHIGGPIILKGQKTC
jgi:hypothetical protein